MTSPPDTHAFSTDSLLIETKFHIPLLREEGVSRSELVELVQAAYDCKVVLIDAPAGYGKTTLLAEWGASERESRPFAWVSLEPADQDPARLDAETRRGWGWQESNLKIADQPDVTDHFSRG